jgi:hypothetical protein
MILLPVVIDAHEEAAVLYAPVWFSVLTHNKFAIFGGRSKSHSAFPKQVKKAMTTSFAKIFSVCTRASRSMGVGKREKRNAEKTIVSPGTGP